MSGQISAPTTTAMVSAQVPYVFMSGGLNPGMAAAQVAGAHEVAQKNHPDVLTAFREAACDGIEVSRFVANDHANNALLKANELLGRKKFSAAAKTLFAFSKDAWQREVFRMAERTALFAAALGADLATRKSLDLSDASVRDALFTQLTRAKVVEMVGTEKYPAKLGLGEKWALFREVLGGSVEASFAQMFTGAGYVIKHFSYRVLQQHTYESIAMAYTPSADTLNAMLTREVNALRAMKEKGIPVVDVLHVAQDAYVRNYIKGGVYATLGDPLMGIDTSEQLQAGRKWYERALQIQQAGFWTNASLPQMRNNMVYSIEDHDWKVFGTLPETHV